MSETKSAGEAFGEWFFLDDVPYSYQLAGTLLTVVLVYWFVAGPRVPILAPENEFLRSMATHPMFIPSFVATWPLAFLPGRFLGGIIWLLRGGDA